MAQSSPWVGDWDLKVKDTPIRTITAILHIKLKNEKLEGKIQWTSGPYQGGTEDVEHFNDLDNELILGLGKDGSDDLFFPLTLRIEDDETLSGTWKEVNSENASYNVIAERRVAQSSDYSNGNQLQSSDTWVGVWGLYFLDSGTEEVLFEAILTIDLEDNNMVGTILYSYPDGTEEDVVIEHFDDEDTSGTELRLGFKRENSRDFPLTLRYDDFTKETSGFWVEEQGESYGVFGRKRQED